MCAYSLSPRHVSDDPKKRSVVDKNPSYLQMTEAPDCNTTFPKASTISGLGLENPKTPKPKMVQGLGFRVEFSGFRA